MTTERTVYVRINDLPYKMNGLVASHGCGRCAAPLGDSETNECDCGATKFHSPRLECEFDYDDGTEAVAVSWIPSNPIRKSEWELDGHAIR